MNRTLFSFCLLTLSTLLGAQKNEGTTFLVYNPQNMNSLEFRAANSFGYPNISQVLRLRNAAQEFYYLEIGTGIYASNVPENAQNSQGFEFTEKRMADINNRKSVLQIVQQAGGHLIVSPVLSVTRAVISGNFLLLNGADYSLMVDNTYGTIGQNVATSGSLRDVVLVNSTKRGCKQLYTFRRTSSSVGAEIVDFDFIPGYGVVAERIGRTAEEMKQNERQLASIDSKPLDDLILSECGGSIAGTSPKNVNTGTVNIGPKIDESSFYGNDLTSKGVMISAISNHPVANCGKNADLGYHIVQPKETVSSIARFYGISPRQIIDWNQIVNPNLVSVCQELRILPPGAKSVAQTKSPVIIAQALSSSSIVAKTPLPKADVIPALTPSTELTTQIAGQKGRFYAVQPGENVYQVAKKFGYTEERLRLMNTFPTSGDVPLQVGQLLKVSDCEEPSNTQLAPPDFQSARTPGAANSFKSPTINPMPSIPALTPTTIGQNQAPALPSTVVSTQTNAAAASSSQNNNSQFVPLTGSSTSHQLYLTPTVPQIPTPTPPVSYQDYKVVVGESIRSIAIKKKLDPVELGLINRRSVEEILPIGTNILLPIY